MTAPRLKPCPFCGDDLCVSFTSTNPQGHSVGCLKSDCRAFGPIRKTIGKAIAAWNRRAKTSTITPAMLTNSQHIVRNCKEKGGK